MIISKSASCLLIVILMSLECNNSSSVPNKNDDEFIFSYADLGENYSIMLNNSDSIYFERRFPKPKKLFFVSSRLVNTLIRQKMEEVVFTKLDTTYIQTSIVDGSSFMFFKKLKSGIDSFVYVYCSNAPSYLYEIADYIDSIRLNLNFIPINGLFNFKKKYYFEQQKIPPPIVND